VPKEKFVQFDQITSPRIKVIVSSRKHWTHLVIQR